MNIKKRYGVAKVIGTVVCIGGATIITLYKGPPLLQEQPHLAELREAIFFSPSRMMNWTLGCGFVLLNCIAWSAWMVFQVTDRSKTNLVVV